MSRPLYFGYGSNLWLDQMHRRCPDSELRGVGLLRDWKWLITDRGYANIIPSVGDVVYGLVFYLSIEDEATLDIYESVPVAYEKEYIPIEFTPKVGNNSHPELLIYLDHIRVTPNKPKEEYIYRINKGIEDAIKEGIPSDYFKKYFQPFIPPPQSPEQSESYFAANDRHSAYGM